MTNIRINIDALTVEGAAQINPAQLTQAIQQALMQQVAKQGLPTALHVPHTRRTVQHVSAETVANQITQTIYGGQK